MTSRTIVVTDAETRAALAAARSLGKGGHRVHVIAKAAGSLAGASRHVQAEHVLPDAESNPAAWAEELENLIRRIGADWVLPIAEISLGTSYEFGLRERLPLIAPSREAYSQAIDKYGILEIAAGLGLHVPRGVLVEDPRRLESLPKDFEYPVVLKARRSRFRVNERWELGGVATVRSPTELAAAVTDPGFAGGLVLQEYIAGHGEAIFVLIDGGARRAAFAHRRLREKPPTGGVSVLREAVEPDPQMLEATTRLLTTMGYRGAAMVEYRRSPGGDAFLMEINPRLWGSLQLAIDANVDFPDLLLRTYEGGSIDAPRSIVGTRSRWLLGDVDHLLISLRRPEMREATGRTLVQVLIDFFRSFFDGSKLEVLRWDDWRPFVRELAQWLRGRG